MKLSEVEIQRLYQQMTARRSAGDCLDEEMLMRRACGEASVSEREEAVGHIARCSDCAREYQIARGMRPLRGTSPRFMNRLPLAAAAIIAIAVGAVAWMAVVQQRNIVTIERLQQQLRAATVKPARSSEAPRISESPRMQVGSPIVDLDADLTRGSTSIPNVVVPPSSTMFTLILHLPRTIDGDVDLDLDGRDATRAHPSGGTLTLTINRQSMTAGEHVIHVRGVERRVSFRFSLATQ